MKQIPQTVLDEAKKRGLGDMKFCGVYNDSQVFGEVPDIDENGFVVPTGLPCYILLKDGKVECVDGIEALKITF